MLFEYLCLTPTIGTIELGNHRFFIFDAYLVDTIFITIQRQDTRIRAPSGGFHRIDHHIWLQYLIRMTDDANVLIIFAGQWIWLLDPVAAILIGCNINRLIRSTNRAWTESWRLLSIIAWHSKDPVSVSN